MKSTIKPELNQRVELIGQRFGLLVVVGPTPYKGKVRRTWWECKCDCGEVVPIREAQLIRRQALSCGCMKGRRGLRKMSDDDISLLSTRSPAGRWRFYQYYYGAQNRGYRWDISEDDFFEITSRPCEYCGVAAGNTAEVKRSKSQFAYNGLDRVDNTKGYILSNVVPCCGMCNRSKYTHSREKFLEWALRLAEHQQSEKELAHAAY